MSEEQARLIMDILNGLCDYAVFLNENGFRECHFCGAEEAGYYDSHYLTHQKSCPVTLNEQLQATRR